MNKVLKLEKILSWRGLSQLLVKELGFQLCGRDNPQNDTMPSFFHDSMSSSLVLSKDVSFVSEFFQKGD